MTDHDVEALIVRIRARYGDQFVDGRAEAERKAVELLDRTAGSMTREQAQELGGYLNVQVVKGTERHDRFAPAFVGGSLNTLIRDLDRFNRRVEMMWRSSEEEALDALDESLLNRQLFPGAG